MLAGGLERHLSGDMVKTILPPGGKGCQNSFASVSIKKFTISSFFSPLVSSVIADVSKLALLEISLKKSFKQTLKIRDF